MEEYIEPEVTETDVTQDKSKHKKSVTKFVIGGLCGALVSGALGFGGGLLALKMTSNTGRDVIYQSVALQDSEGEALQNMSTTDVVKNVKDSVVEIKTSKTQTNIFMQQYVTSGAGSGVILSKEGLIITNHHVIEGATEVTVRTSDGKEHEAEIIASDPQTDIAVLRIKADNLKPAILGNSDTLTVGQDVLAIGNPLGSLGGTVTEGILSAKDREITIDGQNMTLLQVSAAINPGNSGGGLFNAKGELIGIVNAKSSGSDIEGLGFAIPINIASQVAEDLVEKGKVTGRITLGISYLEINSVQQAMQNGVNTLGLLVKEVTPNSNASRAGVQPEDIIIGVNGIQVTSSAELKSELNKSKVGDSLTLTVVRDRQQLDLTATLQE